MADGKSVFAKGDRGIQDPFEIENAVALVGDEPAVHQAGDGDAQNALHGYTAPFQIDFPGGRPGGGAGGVDGRDAAGIGPVDEQKTVASHARCSGFDHAKRGGRRNRGVDGVAAGHERADAGLGCQGMAGGNKPVLSHHRWAKGVVADTVR